MFAAYGGGKMRTSAGFVLAMGAYGHFRSLFFPGTVKSCSNTVDKVVLRDARKLFDLMLFDVPVMLRPLAAGALASPRITASLCDACRPSLIATAV